MQVLTMSEAAGQCYAQPTRRLLPYLLHHRHSAKLSSAAPYCPILHAAGVLCHVLECCLIMVELMLLQILCLRVIEPANSLFAV